MLIKVLLGLFVLLMLVILYFSGVNPWMIGFSGLLMGYKLTQVEV